MTDFQYTIKAHPTTYAGVNFRSRLEATWAAFFDLCGWRWDYEPLDLNGWVPDFVLEKSVAVEIKPVMKLGDLSQEYVLRMGSSGWPGPIWVLGVSVDALDKSAIGWSLSGAGYSLWPSRNQRVGGSGEFVAYSDNVGVVTVDYVTESMGGAYSKLQDAWNQAKNTVQWKPNA